MELDVGHTVLLPKFWHQCPEWWKNVIDHISLSPGFEDNRNQWIKDWFWDNYQADVMYGDDWAGASIEFPNWETFVACELAWNSY